MADDQISQEIHHGRYHLVKRVCADNGQHQVIKTIATDNPQRAEAADRLRFEHDLLVTLDLPGVVKSLGFYKDAGAPALLLEDAGAQNLKEWLRRRPLDPTRFLHIAIAIAEVVERLHDRGVIHRDINPTNIVLDASDRITLIDFETAAVLPETGTASIEPSRLEGTLPYIAPEQTGRMNRLVDHRADLYSLGVTFYEMLVGALPFPSVDPVELLHAHLARTPVPPNQIALHVPAVLSDIVCRLLAKMPEERYQSAHGLLVDLREALARLERTGDLEPFELGLGDLARALPMPDRLYGREHETTFLEEIWQNAVAGGNELVLLSGEAGIGKTALLGTLRAAVAHQHGQVLIGKFDLRQGNRPYAGLVQALRHWLRELPPELLTEGAALPRRLREAMGPSACVLTGLVPELEPLLGRPAEVQPAAGPTEAENRLHYAILTFLRALAHTGAPLALCLDDLHWADEASLKLLRVIARSTDLTHLLIVGALRPQEGTSALAATLAELRANPRPPRELTLGPLGGESLEGLVAETLRCGPDRAAPLAALILRKTGGNPFFCQRLLRYLQQRGLLSFDAVLGQWGWDLGGVESVQVTDNVAELMVETLRRLPYPTRAALSVAACIGSRFSLGLVAKIRNESRDLTAAALWVAVREGHLVALEAPQGPTGEQARFQFVHDRIQQAAYGLASENERGYVHLSLGRELLSNPEYASGDEAIFAVADHLVLGAVHVTDPGERLLIAEHLLRAGQSARNASAYGPALAYEKHALALLPADVWSTEHGLAATLHHDAIECALVTRDDALADTLFATALEHADTATERAELYLLRAVADMGRGRLEEGIGWTNAGLRLFGIDLDTVTAEMVAAEVARVEAGLAARPLADVLAGPPMQNRDHLTIVRLLSGSIIALFFRKPQLWTFAVARMINMSLAEGVAPSSPMAFLAYGVSLQKQRHDFDLAHKLGRFAISLAERFEDPGPLAKVLTMFGTTVGVWREPLDTVVTLLRQAQARGLEAGDFMFAVAGAAVSLVAISFHRGAELGRVLGEIEAALPLARRTSMRAGVDDLLAFRKAIAQLGGYGDVGEIPAETGPPADQQGLETLALAAAYITRDFDKARRLEPICAALAPVAARATFELEANYYGSLTLAAVFATAPAAAQEQIRTTIAANQTALLRYSEGRPDSFRHKYLLVEAERARIEGRPLDAAELYEEAIEGARREQFLQDEAIANELCGRFHHNTGRTRFAKLYLTAALDGYNRWGAKAKADALEEEFPELRPALAAMGTERGGGSVRNLPSSASLDLVALFRAGETLSREVVHARLLGKLMEVCLATAGAERGALALMQGDDLILRATGSVNDGSSLHDEPAHSSKRLPASVVGRVLATREPVVLADASNHPDFRADPYITPAVKNPGGGGPVRSLAALPILRQGKLIGVLYLENNLATRVFTASRLQLLRLLSAQIATALENSLLFQRLTGEVEERKRAESSLRFLEQAGATLSESLDYEATLNQLAHLAVPSLADWCVVDVVDGDKIRRVAAAHVDPVKQELLERLGQMPEQFQARSHITEVLATRAPLLYGEVPRMRVDRYKVNRELANILESLDVQSSMVLPLLARGRPVGAMSLVSSTPGRRFNANDLALAQDLARRAAVAIDNARLYREAQEAVRLRDDFLSIASHELNAPLSSLWLVVQGLEESSRDLSTPVLLKTTQIISRQTRRLKTLVADLLDLAHIHTGQLRLRRSEVDLGNLLSDTLDRFSEDLARAGCAVTLRIDQPIVGNWDRSRLEQVVTNLLSNAIKFAPGKPIEITCDCDGISARLAIEDHGIGIPPESLPHVFGRFERAVSAANYGGLGLGLYIVHEIVEAHGGTVVVESVLGAGCKFTVDLPLGFPVKRGATAPAPLEQMKS